MAMEFGVGVGYKFKPSDIELIEYYLLNKITNQPLPVQGHVIECDVYDEKQMSNIFNTVKTNLYVFTQLKKKSGKGKRIDRTVGKMGTWKAIDAPKPIEDDHGRVIGGKRSLDYENKERSGEHGAWNMKEYSLDGASLARINDLKLKDYVLCFIQRKRRVTKRATTGDDSEHGIETVICDDDQLIKYGYLNNNKRARRSDEECNQPSNSGFRFGFNDDALDKPAVPKEVEQRDSSIFKLELDNLAKFLGVDEPTVMQDGENIATTLGNERPALDDEALKYIIDPSVCDDEQWLLQQEQLINNKSKHTTSHNEECKTNTDRLVMSPPSGNPDFSGAFKSGLVLASVLELELENVAKFPKLDQPTRMQDPATASDGGSMGETIATSHVFDSNYWVDSFVKDLSKGEQLPLPESEIEMLSNTFFGENTFEEEERELLPLMEATELSREQQEKVPEQCLDVMQGTHSHLFHFFIEALLPQDAMHYLDLVIKGSNKEQVASMLRRIIE
ncbi:hypothetical protein TEA_014907 [Camellia sinensis var. sinensis]|uniref:NAC domain-containing protein n=1 Tax=Camellia sinensis var. sinensis TaxID=542762 RepID=A0A4S4F3Z9_CAMSN|nr:hypothetical protein TEA_014907 [Camellia sinensis var. sinensis]